MAPTVRQRDLGYNIAHINEQLPVVAVINLLPVLQLSNHDARMDLMQIRKLYDFLLVVSGPRVRDKGRDSCGINEPFAGFLVCPNLHSGCRRAFPSTHQVVIDKWSVAVAYMT